MSDIIERVKELESRLESIESTNTIFKTSFDKLEREVLLLRKIAIAVDLYQRETKCIAGDFAELYTLITEYRQEQQR